MNHCLFFYLILWCVFFLVIGNLIVQPKACDVAWCIAITFVFKILDIPLIHLECKWFTLRSRFFFCLVKCRWPCIVCLRPYVSIHLPTNRPDPTRPDLTRPTDPTSHQPASQPTNLFLFVWFSTFLDGILVIVDDLVHSHQMAKQFLAFVFRKRQTAESQIGVCAKFFTFSK